MRKRVIRRQVSPPWAGSEGKGWRDNAGVWPAFCGEETDALRQVREEGASASPDVLCRSILFALAAKTVWVIC